MSKSSRVIFNPVSLTLGVNLMPHISTGNYCEIDQCNISCLYSDKVATKGSIRKLDKTQSTSTLWVTSSVYMSIYSFLSGA